MGAELIRQAVADLQACSLTDNEDDIAGAMSRLQSTLGSLDSSEVLVAREGQPYLDALQALKWTLDDLLSVCERRHARAAQELASMQKGTSGAGNYQALSQFR
jgi:hypothetical protein